MKKSYLRDFIRSVLLEQQKYFDVASKSNYAIILFARGQVYNCILYNVNDVEALIHNKNFNSNAAVNPVVSYVSYVSKGAFEAKCHNGSEVLMSAAQKNSKMGIVAYESALYYATQSHGGLYADRSKPSPSALSVWKKYSERSDVEHLRFDDIQNPKTPPPGDDCELVSPSGKNSYIDNVYRLREKPAELSALEDSHTRFMNSDVISDGDFKREIKAFASKLFHEVY